MLRLIYHSQCFDGAVSAALFSRFYRERLAAGDRVEYVATTYSKAQCVDPLLFAPGREANAIVDFKYSSDERVGWWFDHHQRGSTFGTPAEAAHYEANASSPLKHYDPSVPSCAGLIYRVLETGYAFAPPEVADSVAWADRIDSGRFESAAEAVELRAPALRLGLVIQHTYSDEFAARLIDDLGHMSLDEVIAADYVADRLPELLDTHETIIADVRDHAEIRGDVLFYDVAHRPYVRVDRYLPYYLAGRVRYSVGICRLADGVVRIAVGHNPWSPMAQSHSIARVCEHHGGQYGGGGHHGIGGITLGESDYDLATSLARDVVTSLNAAPCEATSLQTAPA